MRLYGRPGPILEAGIWRKQLCKSECALLYESESGVRSGDGLLCLQSKAIGYQETLQLKGVRATRILRLPENSGERRKRSTGQRKNKNLVDRAGGLRDGILS